MAMHITASLREFFAPIPDQALPRLQQQSVRGIRLFCVLVGLFGPGALASLPIELLTTDTPARSVLVAGVSGLAALLAFVLARPKWVSRHLQTAHLLVLSIPATAGAVVCWANPVNVTALPLLIMIPLITLFYYPLRPTIAALAQLPMVVAISAGYALADGGPLAPPPAGVLSAAFVLAMVGAASSQVMRRRWLEVERMKDQLIATERMTTLGAMSARIAHELKTPIAAVLNAEASIRDTVDELKESIGDSRVTDDDLREIAGEIAQHVECVRNSASRAGRFIQAVREHAAGAVRREECTFFLRDRIDAVLELLSFRLRRSKISIDVEELPAEIELHGVAERFDQIATNLISNALDACEESGQGTKIRVTAHDDGAHVRFTVEDDGPGVAETIRDRVFSPLVTSRSRGTGLGLAIARDIASACFSGTLELHERSRFELCCPSRSVSGQRAEMHALPLPSSDGRAWLEAATPGPAT